MCNTAWPYQIQRTVPGGLHWWRLCLKKRTKQTKCFTYLSYQKKELDHTSESAVSVVCQRLQTVTQTQNHRLHVHADNFSLFHLKNYKVWWHRKYKNMLVCYMKTCSFLVHIVIPLPLQYLHFCYYYHLHYTRVVFLVSSFCASFICFVLFYLSILWFLIILFQYFPYICLDIFCVCSITGEINSISLCNFVLHNDTKAEGWTLKNWENF